MKKLITIILILTSLFCKAQSDNVHLVVIPDATKHNYIYNKTTYEIAAYIADNKVIVFDSLATIKILFADLQECRKVCTCKVWKEAYYLVIEELKKCRKRKIK